MYIHFVCRGNAYRSRLAEAYLRSKQLPALLVSSSGIEAAAHAPTFNGPISWAAQRILQHNGLVPFMSFQPTQTTLELLQAADLVIFMEAEHLRVAREQFGYAGEQWQIWHIPDIVPSELAVKDRDLDMAIIQASEITYRSLQEKIAVLIVNLPEHQQQTSLG